MAETCSHHDKERKNVGATAHAVASMRHLESLRPLAERLFTDPFAEALGGPLGKSIIATHGTFTGDGTPRAGLVDLVAARTRKIDDELSLALTQHGIRQVCALGAGLDARPWRLSPPSVAADPSFGSPAASAKVKYFEVDFPEIFEYKLPVLQAAGATSAFDYISVQVDLALPDWEKGLLSAGFQPDQPTFWIVEGVTGYLTEEELNALITKLTQKLSAVGSRFVATFITAEYPKEFLTPMHRFTPDHPMEYMAKFGWVGVQESINAVGEAVGRPIRGGGIAGYHVVVASLPSVAAK
eukprot:RCo007294